MAGDVQDPNEGTTKYLAEGQAAFWLMECLLLALVEDGIVEKDRLIELIENVIEAKRATAAESAAPVIPQASVALLSSLANSMSAADTTPKGTPDRPSEQDGSGLPRRRGPR